MRPHSPGTLPKPCAGSGRTRVLQWRRRARRARWTGPRSAFRFRSMNRTARRSPPADPRITVAGDRIVEEELTAEARRHGLALALPETVALAPGRSPDGGAIRYRIRIRRAESRDAPQRWLGLTLWSGREALRPYPPQRRGDAAASSRTGAHKCLAALRRVVEEGTEPSVFQRLQSCATRLADFSQSTSHRAPMVREEL